MSGEINRDSRAVAYWLFGVCALVFAMVVLGGVTRLTGSGLSMVDWAPLMGIVPPLGAQEWQRSFELYQQFPEYQKINAGMSLAGYKSIFWFEYAHRLLGRAIGLAFFLPFMYFLVRQRLPRGMTPKLLAMFVLGGLQGLLGWYMVKSGLVNDPHVSQYRLTAHLMLAFAIYAYMLWVAMGLLLPRPQPAGHDKALRNFASIILVLVTVTVISGGFVAGLKAGLVSDTFPFMYGVLIPDQIYPLAGLAGNLFEDPVTVQFNHRVLASATFVLVCVLCFAGLRAAPPGHVRSGFIALLLSAVIQLSLGIGTIIAHVPVALAATHQAGALVLFTSILFVCRALQSAAPRTQESRS